jgi:hypothetical protein
VALIGCSSFTRPGVVGGLKPDGTGAVDVRETIRANGHEHVRAAHGTTLEVTTDGYLTPAGDCIVGVGADRAPADFDGAFVDACRATDARVTAVMSVYDSGDGREPAFDARIEGHGHPELTFESDRAAVVRTSDYVDDRTVAVGADRAAADLDRGLVEVLADGGRLEMTITVDR